MSGLDNFVEIVCPLSACGLGGDGGSDELVNEETVDSAVESPGGNVEGLGEGLPLRKGIAAPPSAACLLTC